MVMAIITRSKALEEVAFQKRELLKGKDPQNWQEEKFKQLMVEIVQELQKDEKIQELQHEVATIQDPSWCIEWVGLLSIMEHLKVLPTPTIMNGTTDIGQ